MNLNTIDNAKKHPTSTWWKSLASLTMIALSIIFVMNFVEVWQSSQTHTFFSYSEKTIRNFVDEPKCANQFLTMVTQMKSSKFSSSSTSSWTNHIVQGIVPCIMHEPLQSLQFCMNFNHLWVVLIIYYKCMHLIIHFNPGATWLVSSHLFPFSRF
jgi:hypothetical protein